MKGAVRDRSPALRCIANEPIASASGEAEPKSFREVAAKVRQRGKEYGEALTEEYPQIMLMAPHHCTKAHTELLIGPQCLHHTRQSAQPSHSTEPTSSVNGHASN